MRVEKPGPYQLFLQQLKKTRQVNSRLTLTEDFQMVRPQIASFLATLYHIQTETDMTKHNPVAHTHTE